MPLQELSSRIYLESDTLVILPDGRVMRGGISNPQIKLFVNFKLLMISRDEMSSPERVEEKITNYLHYCKDNIFLLAERLTRGFFSTAEVQFDKRHNDNVAVSPQIADAMANILLLSSTDNGKKLYDQLRRYLLYTENSSLFPDKIQNSILESLRQLLSRELDTHSLYERYQNKFQKMLTDTSYSLCKVNVLNLLRDLAENPDSKPYLEYFIQARERPVIFIYDTAESFTRSCEFIRQRTSTRVYGHASPKIEAISITLAESVRIPPWFSLKFKPAIYGDANRRDVVWEGKVLSTSGYTVLGILREEILDYVIVSLNQARHLNNGLLPLSESQLSRFTRELTSMQSRVTALQTILLKHTSKQELSKGERKLWGEIVLAANEFEQSINPKERAFVRAVPKNEASLQKPSFAPPENVQGRGLFNPDPAVCIPDFDYCAVTYRAPAVLKEDSLVYTAVIAELLANLEETDQDAQRIYSGTQVRERFSKLHGILIDYGPLGRAVLKELKVLNFLDELNKVTAKAIPASVFLKTEAFSGSLLSHDVNCFGKEIYASDRLLALAGKKSDEKRIAGATNTNNSGLSSNIMLLGAGAVLLLLLWLMMKYKQSNNKHNARLLGTFFQQAPQRTDRPQTADRSLAKPAGSSEQQRNTRRR